MHEPSLFGRLLKRYRLAAGLPQEALAERAGLSPRGVSDLERGVHRGPQRETVRRLAEALGLSPGQRGELEAAVQRVRRGGAAPDSAVDARWDAPPLGQASPLPVYLTSFVGREAEGAEVVRLLGGTRLLTLTGAGGSGKTRLAVHAAACLTATYPAGLGFVDLAPLVEPALVPAAVLAALGLREAPGRTPLDLLAAHLRDRTVLLLLDNCEHLVGACAWLAERLLGACPALRVLATSREPLGLPGERVWRVPSLGTPEAEEVTSVEHLAAYPAVRLFVDRAAAAAPGFALTPARAGAVARLCRRLDGIPLAIEMAAVRVRALAVEQIAARLDEALGPGGRFGLLTAGSRTAPPRQQTLRAALDWSHDLLAEPERRLFRRLGVFAGGFTLEAAEAVCPGAPAGGYPVAPGQVLGLLAALVDKSLLTAEEQGGAARYRLLETVRAYALERLAESGEEEAARAGHAASFLGLAEAAVRAYERTASRALQAALRPETENMRAALAWLAARADPLPAYRLAQAFAMFLELVGRVREGADWLAAVLTRPAPAAALGSPERAGVLLSAFQLAELLGDLAGARALLAEVLAIHRARTDRAGEALALGWLGAVARDQGALEEARAFLEAGLALHRALGDRAGAGAVLDRLGTIAQLRGDLTAAQRLYAESEASWRDPDQRFVLPWSLHNQALLALERGRTARAARLARESALLRRANVDRPGSVYALALLAGVAAAQAGAAGAPRAARALRLAGAVDAEVAARGQQLMPMYRDRLAAAVAAARRALAPAAAAAAWADGRALSLDAALTEALSETAPAGCAGVVAAGHGPGGSCAVPAPSSRPAVA